MPASSKSSALTVHMLRKGVRMITRLTPPTASVHTVRGSRAYPPKACSPPINMSCHPESVLMPGTPGPGPSFMPAPVSLFRPHTQ
eukprot:3792465-Rhodomonas_salina.2